MNNDPMPEDDPALRETLKRCSPATYYAACKFRQTGRPEDLRAVVLGVIERFVERDVRPKLHARPEGLRLREDLAIDSLTMMEIVMLAEEVLRITVSNEELTQLRTIAEVLEFIQTKLNSPRITKPSRTEIPEWNLGTLGEQVRQIEANAASSRRLANEGLTPP